MIVRRTKEIKVRHKRRHLLLSKRCSIVVVVVVCECKQGVDDYYKLNFFVFFVLLIFFLTGLFLLSHA